MKILIKVTLKISCNPGSSFDKKHQIFSLNKLNSAALYGILIDANRIKPTSQIDFENLVPNFKPDQKSIHLLPGRATLDTNLRMLR